MYIHTVVQGDSIWQLAKKYSISVANILDINHLNEKDALVIGQAVLIPTLSSHTSYTVKANETLAQIAKMFGVTITSLMNTNHIQNPALIEIGSILKIPSITRTEIEVNAYINQLDTHSSNHLQMNADNLTYVSIFSYSFTEQGSLIALDDTEVIAESYANYVIPMMSITNIVDHAFSVELMHALLTNEALQKLTINSIINMMNEKGYKALNVDFEYIPSALKLSYNSFLKQLAQAVHAEDYFISSALPPKLHSSQEENEDESPDYLIHGQLIDFVIIMTYEWGWTGGPPRAVAPLNEIKKVMEYASSMIAPDKLMMSIPLYGYDWTLPFIEGESLATAIVEQQALDLARRHHAIIEYDEVAQSPYFTYYDEHGKQHVVWFEDARSYQAKMNLVKSLNLRGISYWKLSMPAPINWVILSENFYIKKRL